MNKIDEEYEYKNNSAEDICDAEIYYDEGIDKEELYGILEDTEETQTTIRRKIKKMMKMQKKKITLRI